MIDLLMLKRKARDKEPYALLYACAVQNGQITAQCFQFQKPIRKDAKLTVYDAQGRSLGAVLVENHIKIKPQTQEGFTVEGNKVKLGKAVKSKPLPEGTLLCYGLYLNGVFRRVSK